MKLKVQAAADAAIRKKTRVVERIKPGHGTDKTGSWNG
jgi:hypothetical protein